MYPFLKAQQNYNERKGKFNHLANISSIKVKEFQQKCTIEK